MRKSLALAMTAAMTTGLAALVPAAANAANSNTTVTFTLQGGTLSISAPASANLGTVNSSTSATTVSGQIGSTTVTDTRGNLVGLYNVTVTSSDFATGGGTTLGTDAISGATVTAFSGAASFSNATPGAVHLTTSVGVPATGLTPIEGDSAYTGSDTSSYNPTVTIPIPATNIAGTYTGTITQTVT